MGAWATDSFGNDDALDWLIDFVETPTIEMLRDTLGQITNYDPDEMPEAPDCAEAIAAGEIVAAIAGRPAANLPDDLKTWLQTGHGLNTEELLPAAVEAIRRVAQASELKELWTESDFSEQWVSDMNDLMRRLS